ERVHDLLAAIGSRVTYLGEGEVARLVKICHNLLLGVVAQSMAEITVLAEKGGVSRYDFLGFLNHSVMGSVFTRYKTPAYVNLDFTPTFTPVLLRKDFDLGLAAARRLGTTLPVAALVHQLVSAEVNRGHVDEDFAILLRTQAESSGLRLRPENRPVSDGLTPEDQDRQTQPRPTGDVAMTEPTVNPRREAGADPPAVDLVVRGGRVWTGERDGREPTALAVRDGRILAVGTDEELAPLARSAAQVLDLAGERVLPG